MFANAIVKYRYLIIILILGVIISAVFLLGRLNVDVRFSTFFPGGDEQLSFYEAFTERMGSTDPFVFVAIQAKEKIFDIDFLKRVAQLVDACEGIPNVKGVNSITNSSRYIKTPFGIINSPYLHLDTPEKLAEDSVRIIKDDYLTKRFFSVDKKFLSIIIELEKDIDLEKAGSAIDQLDTLLQQQGFDKVHLLGRKYMEVQYKKAVTKELGRSLLLSLIFIALILGILYRSLSGILLPLLSMLFALLILYGYMALTGRSLGILANLFPTIMLIVGISDVIHIFTKFNFEIQQGVDKKQAVIYTIREIGLTIFLTSFTTAIGFLTLSTSSMAAIKNFGFDAAVGVIIAYIVSILFVPASLLVLGLKMTVKNKMFSTKWGAFSEKIFSIVNTKSKEILVLATIIFLISLAGIYKINTNNLQLTNIPDTHRLKSDFNVFEKEMGGGRAFEMAIISKGKNGFDLANLEAIRKLHLYLESIDQINKVFSPMSFYHGISKVYQPRLELFQLPQTTEKLKSYVRKFDKSLFKEHWKLVDSTQTHGRISARMKDVGRLEVKAINNKIETWINANLDTTALAFYFTGTDLLIDRAHELRIRNMSSGLLIAILAVALIMGIVFKKISIVIISLLVNLLPLFLLGGVMGFLDIELRGTSSIIFTIAFVIAVDDTIHFLSKYKIEKAKGFKAREAIRNTIKETLKAVILTSIILLGGFLVLIHSDFWDVYVHGVLISATLLFALIIDMFLLPVLILKFVDHES